MTIDRFGHDVILGWAAHEILWLEAALTLDVVERAEAYHDISEMTGRSVQAIRKKASTIQDEHRMERARASYAATMATRFYRSRRNGPEVPRRPT